MAPTDRAAVRRQRLAAAGLLLAASLTAVALRAARPSLDRLAWAATLDRTAEAEADVVRQRGRSDCGPAALKMVLDHFGVAGATLRELEAATGTGPDGTSMLALKQVAEARGLVSRGLRLSIDQLPELPMPFIAHVHGDHFVVVRSAGNRLVVDDPSLGRLRMSPATFDRSWDGVVLTFRRPSPAAFPPASVPASAPSHP